MATAQNIIGELESLLEGLGFTVVEVDQDRNYGPMKASRWSYPRRSTRMASLQGRLARQIGSV